MEKVLNFPVEKNKIAFSYVGLFCFMKDKQGSVLSYGSGNRRNFVLGVVTAVTHNNKTRTFYRRPDFLRHRMDSGYFVKETLSGGWNQAGVYMFVEEGVRPKVLYVGRASRTLQERIPGYFTPQWRTNNTESHVNRLLAAALKQGKKIALYFYSEVDIEKALHR